jgi:IS5 family transposase
MRTKSSPQCYIDFTPESTKKIVARYRNKYNAVSNELDANPKVLTCVHQDLKKLSSSRKGRKSDYTSEQILRALVVMFVENEDYRGTVVRIANSAFHQHFVRLSNKPVMDFTFLCKAFGVIKAQTWKKLNALLSQYACDAEKITPEKLREDTTAVETNIHYPTDSSLLWDSFRTLARLLQSVQTDLRHRGMTHRFHVKKVKKLAHYISRNAAKRSKREQRRLKKVYGTLIERIRWIVAVAQRAEGVLRAHFDILHNAIANELAHYSALVLKIIDQAQRRVFDGETVPSTEKIYSLFEEHTELLKRGKAGKPIEFGHKVLIAETGEKFIIHYDTYPQQPTDKDLVDETLDAHQKVFGCAPNVFATDKGFYESMEKISELETKIDTVSIAKKGRRTQAQTQREHSDAFREGQRFRAGSEGTISVLKRAFKLDRYRFKGFKNFAASIGCTVFCHNLVTLSRC